jgi:hypothetical protein
MGEISVVLREFQEKRGHCSWWAGVKGVETVKQPEVNAKNSKSQERKEIGSYRENHNHFCYIFTWQRSF